MCTNDLIVLHLSGISRLPTELPGDRQLLYTYINRHAGIPNKTKHNEVCVRVVCFLPNYSGRQACWTYRPGSNRRKSHRISHPPSFCGACLNFSRETDSAVPFPRRPWSLTLCTNDLIVLHLLGRFFFYFFSEEKFRSLGFELTSQRVRGFRGYQLSYRGDLLKSA